MIFCLFLLPFIVVKKSEKYCFEYSNIEVKKIFNGALAKIDYSSFDYDDYWRYEYGDDGKILSINLNQNRANMVLSELMKMFNNNLEALYGNKYQDIDGIINRKQVNKFDKSISIIINMPIGVLSNNSFFYSVGPRIPIIVEVIDTNESAIRTKVKDYGINSVLFEIYAHIEVTGKAILPRSSKVIKTEANVLIDSNLIQGEVPKIYSGNLDYPN